MNSNVSSRDHIDDVTVLAALPFFRVTRYLLIKVETIPILIAIATCVQLYVLKSFYHQVICDFACLERAVKSRFTTIIRLDVHVSGSHPLAESMEVAYVIYHRLYCYILSATLRRNIIY